MTSALLYIVVMALMAAVVFLLAALVFGRGEELPPLPPGASPTRLPAEDVTPDDVRDLRFQQVLRGYKMTEVDWALERLADELDRLRDRVAELEAEAGIVPDSDRDVEPGADGDAEPDVDAGGDAVSPVDGDNGRSADRPREREHDPA